MVLGIRFPFRALALSVLLVGANYASAQTLSEMVSQLQAYGNGDADTAPEEESTVQIQGIASSSWDVIEGCGGASYDTRRDLSSAKRWIQYKGEHQKGPKKGPSKSTKGEPYGKGDYKSKGKGAYNSSDDPSLVALRYNAVL